MRSPSDSVLQNSSVGGMPCEKSSGLATSTRILPARLAAPAASSASREWPPKVTLMTTSPCAAASAKLPAAASRPSSRWRRERLSRRDRAPIAQVLRLRGVARADGDAMAELEQLRGQGLCTRPEPMMPMSMSSSFRVTRAAGEALGRRSLRPWCPKRRGSCGRARRRRRVPRRCTRRSDGIESLRGADPVIYSWSVQGGGDRLRVAGGEGCWFRDAEGRRYLDFASQVMNLNLGHGHPRLVEASAAPGGDALRPGAVLRQRAAV